MKPSEVRRRILEQHAQLRETLTPLEDLAKRSEKGDDQAARELLGRARSLYEMFEAHLDTEDAHLAPALRSAGGEGERRADSLAHEHREQRDLLAYLLGRLDQPGRPTVLIARELRNFAAFLRGEMDHEERTMVTETLLPDA